jgi:hypothetical protein
VRLGRYVLHRTLGHGGMGHVFEAWDPELARCVALKVLDRADPDALALARHEGRCLARLAHPNVVRVHEVGEAWLEGLDSPDRECRAYVAMELIDGEGLRTRRASWRERVDWLLAAGRGLSAIHDAGLVHGDFKTSNLLIGRDGIVRVIDLGLACEPTSSTTSSMFSSRAGTVPFMAPERLEGGPADARGDQWGFCVTAWDLLFGALPFGSWTSPEQVLAAIASGRLDRGSQRPSAEVERVLRLGLAEDPDARPRSMVELLAALERAAELPERRRRRVRRAGFALALAISALGLGVLAGERSRCVAEVEALDRQWDAVARMHLHVRFMTADLPAPRADFEWVAGRLDLWTSQWRDAWAGGCRGPSPIGCDAEVECLRRQRADLAALLELLLTPSHELALASRSLVAQLAPPGECGPEGGDDDVIELAAGERRLALALDAGANERAADELAELEHALERMPEGAVRDRSTAIVDRWRARLWIERGEHDLARELLRDALGRAELAGPALEDVRLALLFERLRLHARSESPPLEPIHDDGLAALTLVERSGNPALHLAWAQAYAEALGRVDVDSALAVLEPTLERLTRSRHGSERLRLGMTISVAELLDRADLHERAGLHWRAALPLAESLYGKQAIELIPVLRGLTRNAMAQGDVEVGRDALDRLARLLRAGHGEPAQSRALARAIGAETR